MTMPALHLLVIILILAAVFSGPWYPYSTGWGYYPFGGLMGLVLLLLILRLFGLL
jgi:hypothetical protein